MTLLRTLSIVLLAGLVLSLAACGGAGDGGEWDGSLLGADGADGADPTQRPPVIRVTNGAKSTIKHIYAYESYTGETLPYLNVYLPHGDTARLLDLNASQYDIYVEYTNGRRSYSGTTSTFDPYNGSSIFRRKPQANPGEDADVTVNYN